MQQQNHEATLKALAKSMKTNAATMGIEMSHAQALEIIARTGGASNWITAKQLLQPGVKSEQSVRSAVIESWDSARYSGDRKDSTQHEVTVEDRLEASGAIHLDVSVSSEDSDTLSASIEVSEAPQELRGLGKVTLPVIRVHRGDDCIASIWPSVPDCTTIVVQEQGRAEQHVHVAHERAFESEPEDLPGEKVRAHATFEDEVVTVDLRPWLMTATEDEVSDLEEDGGRVCLDENERFLRLFRQDLRVLESRAQVVVSQMAEQGLDTSDVRVICEAREIEIVLWLREFRPEILGAYLSSHGRNVFYECETCGQYHPEDFDGDCRDGANSFTGRDLDAMFGGDGWKIAEVTNHYQCVCGHEWADQWSCEVDDDCPECGTSMSPFYSDDGSMPDLDEVATWVRDVHGADFDAADGLSRRRWINKFLSDCYAREDMQEQASLRIRDSWRDSGQDARELQQALEALRRECPDLFEGEEGMVEFLNE